MDKVNNNGNRKFLDLNSLTILYFSPSSSWKSKKSSGRAIIVNIVDEIRPPITTVASGLCTSAPAPVDTAIGKKPIAADAAILPFRLGKQTLELIEAYCFHVHPGGLGESADGHIILSLLHGA